MIDTGKGAQRKGGEPELIEGDVFRTIVPISLLDISMSDNGKMSDKLNVTDKKYRVRFIVIATGANRNRKYQIKRYVKLNMESLGEKGLIRGGVL